MKDKLTKGLVNALVPEAKPVKVFDSEVYGFHVRVQPTGYKCYYVQYRKPDGTRNTYRIGDADSIATSVARKAARKFLASVQLGKDPAEERRKARASNLKKFLKNEYGPWVKANRKSGEGTLERLYSAFEPLLDRKLHELTPWTLERWRTKRIREKKEDKKTPKRKAATINRDLACLRAALNCAVKWKLLERNPMTGLEPLQERDSYEAIRYLSPTEERALWCALDTRAEDMRKARHSGNQWRRERGYKELPDLRKVSYVDHLEPMIILSLNTGLRRGELFNIRWENIDFAQRTLTVPASLAKSGKQRHIPLNETTMDMLKAWREQSGSEGLVFPAQEGKAFDNCRRSWAAVLALADIKKFRWHDMRHDFASKLVMAGVDLNTVRELLGHADIKTTLRYAHLAPEIKASAVARLDGRKPNIIPIEKAREQFMA